MNEFTELLSSIIICMIIINTLGVISNIILIDNDNGTILFQIWNNDMNIFGRLLLTIIILILFSVWTIVELLFRLLKWLCYFRGVRR
ncbi:MAG: hypothetical protein ACI4WW_02740 [Candidatus Coprovivens sp.]